MFAITINLLIMKYHVYTMLLCIAFSNHVFSQNENNPWKLTVGTNAVNLLLEGKDREAQVSPNFSYLEVSRYVGAGFSVDLAGTLNNLDRESGAEDLYYGIDLGTSLSANQIVDLGKFEPTLRAGVGLAGGVSGIAVNDDDFFVTYAGAGLNYWFNDALALTLKTTYKVYSRELDGLIGNDNGGESHFQHLAGLSFAFGGESDSDKDGIKDSEDACPEVAGLESLNGCPDDDGDGIKNSDDDCPMNAGLAALNGCPDSDGDGIKDADDACPSAAGIASLSGCPDRDGDGITDEDDACPTEAGPSSNNGCPVQENPESKIEKPKYPLSLLSGFVIYFDTDEHDVDSLSALNSKLSTVVNVLTANAGTNISIEGHTDSTGSSSYNKSLSDKRAKYIKKRLKDAGISASRLSTKAFGEAMPKASNKTKEGRAANRRVEIKVAY
ncbi:MAG: OmpA family protein [Flavobacteriaceae bacterium]